MPDALVIDSTDVTVRREGLGRRLGWIATLSAVLPCIASMAMPAGLEPIAPFLLLTMGLSPVVALAAVAVRWQRALRNVPVRIDSNSIVIGSASSALRVDRTAITHGWHLPGIPDRVEWALRDGNVVRIGVANEAEAHRVLAASGVDVRHRAVSVRLGTAPGLFALGALGFIVAICPATFVTAMFERSSPGLDAARGPLWFAMIITGIASTIALLAPPRVTVGADGLSVRRTIGSRYVTFADVEAVVNDPLEIVLMIRGGTPLRLPLADIALEQRRALFRRIEDARLAARRRVDPGVAHDLLARNGRTLDDWRAALAAIARGSESYRATTIRRDDLLRVLDDPASPAETRIGAAMALAAESDSDGKTRVRVAALACASEPLRVALERTADGALEADHVADVMDLPTTRRRS